MIALTTAEKIAGPLLSIVPMVLGKNAFYMKDEYKLYIRIAFVFSIIFQLTCYQIIKSKITATNNQSKFKNKVQGAVEEEEVEVTVYDYDIAECNAAMKKVVFDAVIAIVVNWKFKSIQMMFGNILGLIKPILFSGLFREYLYGQKLLRPWEKNAVYGTLTTEDAEIKEVEEIVEDDSKKEETKKDEETNKESKSKKLKED